MTNLKRLLAEATPLPWQRDGAGILYGPRGEGDVAGGASDYNAALIIHAVNRLPDYEALREAAQLAADALPGHLPPGIQEPVNDLRAALHRLRGEPNA